MSTIAELKAGLKVAALADNDGTTTVDVTLSTAEVFTGMPLAEVCDALFRVESDGVWSVLDPLLTPIIHRSLSEVLTTAQRNSFAQVLAAHFASKR
jgi:hypothetical protein